MFRRSRPEPVRPDDEQASPAASPVEALDTLGAVVRTLGEFALDQEKIDAAAFAGLAERWAQHVLSATPPPTGTGSTDGRRDWAGIRAFVADYCRGANAHAQVVMGDLRQVVWVFIRNLSHAFAEDRDSDGRVREQLTRLEKVAEAGAATGDLKREVLATVSALSQTVEERRRRQREQVEVLGAQVRALGSELESARRESETDPLTRLFNRKALDEYLARSVELHRAFGHETSLLLVDIDHFKGINDGFGHTTGDEVLRKVADAATRVFLRRNDFVARYGGDELVVVLRETALPATVALADRLVRLVRTIDIEREGTRVPVTTSVGIAALAGPDVPTWLDAADKALYLAKQRGRDQAAVLPGA
jgi:diguanylate cyclase